MKFVWKMDHAEALEKAEGGDSGVKIEARRKTSAKGEGDGLKRIHRTFEFSKERQEQRVTRKHIWKRRVHQMRNRRRLKTVALALLCSACFFVIALWPTKADGSDEAAKINRVAQRYAEYGYLNGSVLVARHGEVIYARGFGEADIEGRVQNTPTTKFDIASLTKQFTAVLVLQEVEEGKIKLDAHVSDYLPWYRKDTGARMTVEQLLHHTSGLPGDFDQPEFGDGKEAQARRAPREFAEKVCQKDLISEPGTKWQYSNCGYDLLGLILEGVTGEKYSELLQERLLSPLGMKDTGLDQNNLLEKGGAKGYVRHAGPWYSAGPDLDRNHLFAGGGMYSTVEDLLRWNQALNGGSVISKKICEQVFTPGLNDWGYGWFIRKIDADAPGAGEIMAEMRGDMPRNFFAWILRYPGQDAVVIVLRNGYGSTENFEQNLQAVLYGKEARLPKRAMKDIAAQVWIWPAHWMGMHRWLSLGMATCFVIAIWFIRKRPRLAA